MKKYKYGKQMSGYPQLGMVVDRKVTQSRSLW